MDAGTALQHLRQGHRVQREHWQAPNFWLQLNLKGDLILAQFENGTADVWTPSSADLLADDWQFARAQGGEAEAGSFSSPGDIIQATAEMIAEAKASA